MKFTKAYTQQDILAVHQLNSWLGQGGPGRSKAALGRAATISAGMVTQLLNGTYPSPPKQHLDAMIAATTRNAERSESDIPFVPTSVSKVIDGCINRCLTRRDIGVFSGNPGVGKTTAIKHYAEQNPNTTVVFEAFPGATTPVVLRAILRELGVQARRQTVADMHDAIVSALRGSDKVIIVDEAETLAPQALIHLRRISDAANIAIMLIGLPGLYILISDDTGKFGQLKSRVGIWPPVCHAISRHDADAIAASYYGGEAVQPSIMDALWKASEGSARALEKLMCNIGMHRQKTRVEITPALVKKIDQNTSAGRRLMAA